MSVGLGQENDIHLHATVVNLSADHMAGVLCRSSYYTQLRIRSVYCSRIEHGFSIFNRQYHTSGSIRR